MQNLIGAKFPHFLPFSIPCRMKLVILYKVKHLSLLSLICYQYRKVESFKKSRLEAHAAFSDFNPYVL